VSQDPPWYKDAVFYELRAKGLHDSNGDGIGDFDSDLEGTLAGSRFRGWKNPFMFEHPIVLLRDELKCHPWENESALDYARCCRINPYQLAGAI
jgi:hypothetical protein